MKLLIKLVVALLVLLVLIAVGAGFALDSIATKAVEAGGTRALGTPTHLGSADIGLLGGGVTLDGLRVENPEGFSEEDFLALEHGEVEVSLGSLLDDVVDVPLLALRGIDLRLERAGGTTNYGRILESLEKVGGGADQPSGKDAEGKKFRIRELRVEDVTAHVNAAAEAGDLAQITVNVPSIALQNVGTADDGASIAEISAAVVRALLESTIEAGAGKIPLDMLDDLEVTLDDYVDGLGDQLGEQLEQVGGKLGDEAGKVLEDAKKGLGGLLDGKKKN